MNSVRLCLPALLLAGACQNSPPSTPIVIGPARCRPGDTVAFSLLSVDRDGDSVSFFLDWSAGGSSGWTSWYEEGVTVSVPVTFDDSGDYTLTVKARDGAAESDWSDSNAVIVRDYRPFAPRRPSGPDTVALLDTVSYVSAARHPLDERVSLQFRWSDSLGDWSTFVRPETLVVARHVFTTAGLFEVWCRARDAGEHLSDWSVPDSVLVVDSLKLK